MAVKGTELSSCRAVAFLPAVNYRICSNLYYKSLTPSLGRRKAEITMF